MNEMQSRIRQFGQDFHAARHKVRMTLQDVSKKTGISVATISRFERGDFRSIKVETYFALNVFADSCLKINRCAACDVPSAFLNPV